MLEFFSTLPACVVGIEACPSAHYWSRELRALGHTVRLMPPSYLNAHPVLCSGLHTFPKSSHKAAMHCRAPCNKRAPVRLQRERGAVQPAWRQVMTEIKIVGVHPVAQLFPLVNDAELALLAEDIKLNGLLMPITLDPERHSAGWAQSTGCLRGCRCRSAFRNSQRRTGRVYPVEKYCSASFERWATHDDCSAGLPRPWPVWPQIHICFCIRNICSAGMAFPVAVIRGT